MAITVTEALSQARTKEEFLSLVDIPDLKRTEARRIRRDAKARAAMFGLVHPDPRHERLAARLDYGAATNEFFARSERPFKDYDGEALARTVWVREERKRFDDERRAAGDFEIKERLAYLSEHTSSASFKLTRSIIKVISAIVDITHDSARLYCAQSTLARRAKVCRNSAGTVLKLLEQRGVLERVRSGGKDMATGKCHTNKYTIKWNELRDLLGIENKWESRYPKDTTGYNAQMCHRNTFFSYEGCSRHINYSYKIISASGSSAHTRSINSLLSGILGTIRTSSENNAHISRNNLLDTDTRPAKTIPDNLFFHAKSKLPPHKIKKLDALDSLEKRRLKDVCNRIACDCLSTKLPHSQIIDKCTDHLDWYVQTKTMQR